MTSFSERVDRSVAINWFIHRIHLKDILYMDLLPLIHLTWKRTCVLDVQSTHRLHNLPISKWEEIGKKLKDEIIFGPRQGSLPDHRG